MNIINMTSLMKNTLFHQYKVVLMVSDTVYLLLIFVYQYCYMKLVKMSLEELMI
jgi:hypothetical protein